MLNLAQQGGQGGGVPVPAAGSATPVAVRRLQKDYMKLQTDPIDGITALPNENNILEWHYCLRGSPDTPFQGGYYWGKVIFKENFPWAPPAITMITPNGRFATNTRLCLSISDYHPESWNPGWTVSAILIGLHSFMNENQPAAGAVSGSPQEQKNLAMASKEFNVKYREFRKFFPEYVKEWTGVTPSDNEPNVAPVMLPEHATPTGIDVPQIQNHTSRAAFNAAYGRRNGEVVEEMLLAAAGQQQMALRQLYNHGLGAMPGVGAMPGAVAPPGYYPPQPAHPANYLMYYQQMGGGAVGGQAVGQQAQVGGGYAPVAPLQPHNQQAMAAMRYNQQQQLPQQQPQQQIAGYVVPPGGAVAMANRRADVMARWGLDQINGGVPMDAAVQMIVDPMMPMGQAVPGAPGAGAPAPAPAAAAAAAVPGRGRVRGRGRGAPQSSEDDGQTDEDGPTAAKKARVGGKDKNSAIVLD